MKRFCRVAVDSPVLALDRPFDYSIPERMLGAVRVGSVVRIRLHGRRMRGYVTELLDEPAVEKTAPLSELVSAEPLFDAAGIEMARWASRRYVAPVGMVLHQATPGRFSAPPRPALEVATRSGSPDEPPPWLSDPGALAEIVRTGGRAVVVTPDVRADADVIAFAVQVCRAAGRRALVLVPRVAMCRPVAERLGGAVILHGDARPKERAKAWAAARDGSAGVVVGTRAALFVPMDELGLVAVASAHDRSYKEERTPRIHGVVAAAQRARRTSAAFLAVSAAPPLDLAERDGTRWFHPRRVTGVKPEVVRPVGGPVTPRLVDAVRGAVSVGRDALVFSGRRGFALRIRCRECGWYPRCGSCGTGLTVFGRGKRSLRCRSCGQEGQLPDRCPECRGTRLDGAGWGDERLAAELGTFDLGAPVVRVDADAPPASDRPRPAVIVGTQTAVWSVSDVGAVVVADLDQLLGLPDFRAGEHALQTLWDTAGALAPQGRFVVQTREADHHVVQAFTRRSFRYFADRELVVRKAAGYPPFGSVTLVDMPNADIEAAREAVTAVGAHALGPLPRPGGRSALLVRSATVRPVSDRLRELALTHPSVRIDVDPTDVL